MIKVIVFDLWNTLVPATINWPKLISLTKKQHLSRNSFVKKYELLTQRKNFGSYEKLKSVFIKHFGAGKKELLEEELYEIYNKRIKKIKFYPSVKRNLIKLKKQGFVLVLLSNTEDIAFVEVNKKLGIKKYFDFVCLSCDVGAVKPNKKMFKCVLNKTKAKPKEVLMVGDSLRSDINGSKLAGFHNCLINRLDRIVDSKGVVAEFKISSFDELNKVIGVLNE